MRPARAAAASETGERPCVLCGETQSRKALSMGHYNYVSCRGCGLLSVRPFPEIGDLLCRYDDRRSRPVDPSGDPTGEATVHRVRFSEELDRIEAHCRRGRVLDIGCAWGFFLAQCKERGWDAKGVDLSRVQTDYARRRFGLDVFTGPLHDARFPAGHFDVVTLWHVFEHIHDPLSTLVEIRRILKPGGVVVIAVPTPVSAPDYVFDSVPLHLFYFNESTLVRALRHAGFRTIRTRKGGGTGVTALMRNVGVRDPRGLIGRHLSILWKAKKILQRARSLAGIHKEVTVYAIPEGP